MTTCDARVQKLAREAVEKGLVDLDARQGYRKPLAHLKTPQQMAAHEKKLAKEFPVGAVARQDRRGRDHRADRRRQAVGGRRAGAGATWRRRRSTGGRRRRSARARPAAAPAPTARGADGRRESTRTTATARRCRWARRSGWLPLPAAVDRYNPKGLTADKRFAVGDVIRVRVHRLSEGQAGAPGARARAAGGGGGDRSEHARGEGDRRRLRLSAGRVRSRAAGQAAAGLVVQAVRLHGGVRDGEVDAGVGADRRAADLRVAGAGAVEAAERREGGVPRAGAAARGAGASR